MLQSVCLRFSEKFRWLFFIFSLLLLPLIPSVPSNVLVSSARCKRSSLFFLYFKVERVPFFCFLAVLLPLLLLLLLLILLLLCCKRPFVLLFDIGVFVVDDSTGLLYLLLLFRCRSLGMVVRWPAPILAIFSRFIFASPQVSLEPEEYRV